MAGIAGHQGRAEGRQQVQVLWPIARLFKPTFAWIYRVSGADLGCCFRQPQRLRDSARRGQGARGPGKLTLTRTHAAPKPPLY